MEEVLDCTGVGQAGRRSTFGPAYLSSLPTVAHPLLRECSLGALAQPCILQGSRQPSMVAHIKQAPVHAA